MLVLLRSKTGLSQKALGLSHAMVCLSALALPEGKPGRHRAKHSERIAASDLVEGLSLIASKDSERRSYWQRLC
jgi:hypothetical protein